MTALQSFDGALNALVVGASGGIGGALLAALDGDPRVSQLHAWSRRRPTDLPARVHWRAVDIAREDTIAPAAQALGAQGPVHLIIIASGVLHDGATIQPEKSLSALDAGAMEAVLRVNTVGPALVAKHVVPHLPREGKAVLAALSARVGSIGDNRLGGWYAYRASKAALNMIWKNLSIEVARRRKHAVCVGLHPGTVDTDLSEPFQGNVAQKKLFTPAYSAACLLQVIDGLGPEDTGGVFAWDGARIIP